MPARKAPPPAEGASALAQYRAKRDFSATNEPRGDEARGEAGALSFVVQKHWASRLHYDFRLELDGVLLSWAVPKGPSFDPADKPIAIRVEDHPLAYGSFEGTIPKGQYGAGKVIVWDRGTWEPALDPQQGLKDGKLVFTLHGHKLQGLWELVRIAKPGDKQEPWILFKKRDATARKKAEYDVLSALPDSVGGLVIPAMAGIQGSQENGLPPGAIKSTLPTTLSPQLPTLAAAAPTSNQWLWEIKFDGYRILARIEGAKVQLITRGGHDWSAKMPALVQSLAALNLGSAWLDGEIVVMGADGVPSFNALQNAVQNPRSTSIDYFVFDLPYFEGHDLRKVPLVARRQVLQRLLEDRRQPHLRYSAAFEADAAQILESARRMGLEGVMAKRKDAPYESRRTETWLKLKNRQRQEFVVAGYSLRSSGEPEVGALMLGVYEAGGALRYVGNVGTGWDAKTAAALKKQLAQMEVKASPFGKQPVRVQGAAARAGGVHWVRTSLVAEVEFADWTADQQIRHAVFIALRDDKAAAEVQRETAVMPAGPTLAQAGGSVVEGITVSNPERVIDAASGITKLELVRYYASVAAWMLPHLTGRPCSLVRGPQGVGGELFYQKHLNEQVIAEVRELPASVWPEHAPLLEVATPKALVAAAQMNVIEFHTWNAMAKKADKPDRVIFDLDPGEGVRWEHVQEAALLVRGLLSELKLQSWLKTSGGKGLHVVVPLTPRESWDTVKAFSEAVVQHLAQVIPQRFVAKSGPANRIGRIFVDYLRNSHGATTAAAYSARSRPGLGVSMPIAWDELAVLQRSDQWTVRTAREYLSFQTVDPWADYWGSKQTLAAGRRALG
ncbi:DNA ligase D [Caenimonas sedimenti]|uniref:DNA ligase (ATP) n=1 Tax=Caenimonas sedimenti TaxID=2596921 RepID=A0A562ZE60_9BURK|nr:DNA ligase D [Caenimonas sedimenti]TWO64916.1 DNA ligase D [Caenimonas sedimenti]